MVTYNHQFSGKRIWVLFSSCAVPIHIWAFVLFFRDFSWISERTNSWDAVGVGAYGLLISLAESLFVFIIAFIFSLALRKIWSSKKLVVLIGSFAFLIILWTIVGQSYFLLNIRLPNTLILQISRTSHPLRILYGSAIAFITPTIIFPAFTILHLDRICHLIYKFFERLATLSALYLFIDFCCLIIIIIRNI